MKYLCTRNTTHLHYPQSHLYIHKISRILLYSKRIGHILSGRPRQKQRRKSSTNKTISLRLEIIPQQPCVLQTLPPPTSKHYINLIILKKKEELKKEKSKVFPFILQDLGLQGIRAIYSGKQSNLIHLKTHLDN